MKNKEKPEYKNKQNKRWLYVENKKEWFIFSAFISILLGIAGIICCNSKIIPTGYILLGICGGVLLIDLITYILYCKYSTEEKLKREERETTNGIAEEREEWKKNHIKKAVIVATRVATDSDSAIMRGVIGEALIGTSGAVIGTSTAKQKQFTTFLLVYEDDTRETKEVENGSPLYQEYINHIEV